MFHLNVFGNTTARIKDTLIQRTHTRLCCSWAVEQKLVLLNRQPMHVHNHHIQAKDLEQACLPRAEKCSDPP
jgi:hypothetical protein